MQKETYYSDSKGNLYVPFKTDLVAGYLPVDLPKVKDPILHWKGPKIDLETEWYPATSFMYDYQKHEVVLRLFVSPDKKSIVIRPMTQIYGTGLHVQEQPTDEDRREIVALGLTDIGSVHSHCTMKAFASSTDSKDEAGWPGGIHLTVGELDESAYDLHARFAWDLPGVEEEGKVVRKAQRILQAPHLADWFSLPPHAENFIKEEEEIADTILTYLLCKPVDAEYPGWWKSKLIEPVKPSAVTWGTAEGSLFEVENGGSVFFKGAKKKKKGENDIDSFQRRRWVAWQCCMTHLAAFEPARANSWTVDDFKPELRHRILTLYPEAQELLDKMLADIKRLGLSEQDVFNPWQWGEVAG